MLFGLINPHTAEPLTSESLEAKIKALMAAQLPMDFSFGGVVSLETRARLLAVSAELRGRLQQYVDLRDAGDFEGALALVRRNQIAAEEALEANWLLAESVKPEVIQAGEADEIWRKQPVRRREDAGRAARPGSTSETAPVTAPYIPVDA